MSPTPHHSQEPVVGYYTPEPLNLSPQAADFYHDLLLSLRCLLTNKLAVVRGFISLARLSASLDAPVDESLTMIGAAAEEGIRLSWRLHGVAPFSAKIESLELEAFISVAEAELRQPADAAGVHFLLRLRPELTPLMANSFFLKLVLSELLANAAEAAVGVDRQTELEIVATNSNSEQGEGWIDFFVRNTGPDISADQLSKIFTPFYTTKNSPHLGLGLASVRLLVNQMNGQVGVKSGEGVTSFWIRLPAARGK